uniref:GNAT family N-acetyltransferase n=1 Tax=Phenylobacterium glaciei TaxID=2803784 RepID=A0A974SAG9_9CAUL|nr:GNAT family N-acetyltransferase [Phenylobacterium glaciei]
MGAARPPRQGAESFVEPVWPGDPRGRQCRCAGRGRADGGLGPACQSVAIAARLERLRAERATVLLAVEWGPPSGLIIFHPRQTLLADLPIAFVSTLLVGPDARRKGIGRTLLKSASQAARSAGCGELHLSAPRRPTVYGPSARPRVSPSRTAGLFARCGNSEQPRSPGRGPPSRARGPCCAGSCRLPSAAGWWRSRSGGGS